MFGPLPPCRREESNNKKKKNFTIITSCCSRDRGGSPSNVKEDEVNERHGVKCDNKEGHEVMGQLNNPTRRRTRMEKTMNRTGDF